MKPKSVLFIHRSVGRNLIKFGGLYNLLKPFENDFSFSDYDHNTGILSTANSHQKLGYVFPGKNTYPDNLARLFSKPDNKTQPILNWIRQYDVVLLKSCYPTTKIKSNAELEKMKQDYLKIVAYFNETGRQLGLLTPPPMKPRLTKPDWAARARQLSQWLVSTDFGKKTAVFDLFDRLAAPEGANGANCLKREYFRPLFFDAHPNRKGNLRVAPELAKFIKNLAEK